MAQPLIDRVLDNARTLIADRRRRLRGLEAVDAAGHECDPCAGVARRFCAVGAIVRTAYELTGDHERAQTLGWQIAEMIADASSMHLPEGEEGGWALERLSDAPGQAAVLRAIDALIEQRRA